MKSLRILALGIGLVAAGFVLGMMNGCKAANATLPAGAINSFDATSYQSLMVAQATLNTFKAQAPNFPQPPFKTALNQAIADYNVAESAWQVYHAGNGTSAAVTAAMAIVAIDILKINGILGATPTS